MTIALHIKQLIDFVGADGFRLIAGLREQRTSGILQVRLESSLVPFLLPLSLAVCVLESVNELGRRIILLALSRQLGIKEAESRPAPPFS